MAKRRVSEHIKNMSTQRMMETPPSEINDTSQADMSYIVSRLSAVANKRLKAMESKGIKFSQTQIPESISGVKKFGAKGKTLGQLKSEFKRLYGFLNSKMSTLTGRVDAYYEAKKRVAEKRGEEFTQSRNEARKEYYSSVEKRERFDDIGSMFAAMRKGNWLAKYGISGLDSTQVKDLFEEVSMNEYHDWNEMLYDAQERLKEISDSEEDLYDENEGVSVSDWF